MAGRLTRRVRPGLNRISLTGRVRRQALAPGTYRVRRQGSQGAAVYVTIVPAGAGPGYEGEEPRCSPSAAAVALLGELVPFSLTSARPGGGDEPTSAAKGERRKAKRKTGSGVLRAARPFLDLSNTPRSDNLGIKTGLVLLALAALAFTGAVGYLFWWYVFQTRIKDF
jgi:hypothetical protein